MNRRTYAVVLALLVSSSAVGLAVPAAAASVDVTVESVTSSIREPAPGEAFTVTAIVANGPSSGSRVAVTAVTVRDAESGRVYGRVEDAGNVSIGDTLDVPVVTSVDRAGTHQLRVVVDVEDEDGDTHRVRHAYVITVTEPDEAQLSFRTDDPVAGDPHPVEVTVANGDTQTISNLRLGLSGDGNVENPEQVIASLAAGTTSTRTFDVTFTDPGESTIRASVTYTTAEGSTRTVERVLEVAVVPATVEPAFDVAMTTANSSSALRVELQQFGNVALRDVTVRADVAGTPVTQANLPDVPAEGQASATLDASEFPPGELTVVASFTAAGQERTVSRTLTLANDVELAVSTAVVNGSPVLQAELTQYGQVELRDVELRAVQDGEPVARRTLPNVLGGSSRTATFGPGAVPAGEVTVVATYTVGEERRTAETAVTYAPAPTSEITITGLEVTRSGDTLTLRGDAANIGTRAVRSVVLSVIPAAGVTPLNPNKAYFVGAVDDSEFATFELTANVSGDVESVPVRIEYSVDGERVSTVRAIDVTDAEPAGGEGGSGGSLPALPLAVGLVVLLAAGLGLWRWRRA